jgi:hypothetical protein
MASRNSRNGTIPSIRPLFIVMEWYRIYQISFYCSNAVIGIGCNEVDGSKAICLGDLLVAGAFFEEGEREEGEEGEEEEEEVRGKSD